MISSHGTHLSLNVTPCVPVGKADDAFEGCYAFCTTADESGSTTKNCPRCKCRACNHCRHGQKLASLSMPQAKSSRCNDQLRILLVIIRGEAFRAGHMTSRLSETDPKPQLAVLHAFNERVLRPALAAGWSPRVIADVFAPQHHQQRFDQVLRGTLNAIQVRFQPLLATQALTLLRTLHWALEMASVPWEAAFMVRADIEIKVPLAMPSPGRVLWKVRVAYRVPPGAKIIVSHGNNVSNVPLLVADVIQFVPRCRMQEVLRGLEGDVELGAQRRREDGTGRPIFTTLHQICKWLGAGVDWWHDGVFDGNSETELNPIYRQVGRREGLPQNQTWRNKPFVPVECGWPGVARDAVADAAWQRCTASSSKFGRTNSSERSDCPRLASPPSASVAADPWDGLL